MGWNIISVIGFIYLLLAYSMQNMGTDTVLGFSQHPILILKLIGWSELASNVCLEELIKVKEQIHKT